MVIKIQSTSQSCGEYCMHSYRQSRHQGVWHRGKGSMSEPVRLLRHCGYEPMKVLTQLLSGQEQSLHLTVTTILQSGNPVLLILLFSCKCTNEGSPEGKLYQEFATLCNFNIGVLLPFSSICSPTRETISKARMWQDLITVATLCRDSGLLNIYSVNLLISLLIVQGKPNKGPCLSQLLLMQVNLCNPTKHSKNQGILL